MTVTDPQFETVSESKARLTAFCPLEIVTLYADEAPLDEHCLAKAQRDLTRLLKFRFPKASDNEIENIVKKASDAMRNNPLACSNLYAQTCGSPYGDGVRPRNSGTRQVRYATSRKKFGLNHGGRIRRSRHFQRREHCFHGSGGARSFKGPPTDQNVETHGERISIGNKGKKGRFEMVRFS